MLVTFSCKAYADITMFGDVAKELIKYMGHSGAIPGAIKAADVSASLKKLKLAVRERTKSEVSYESKDKDDQEVYVSLDKRAVPLIELLEAAIAQQADVMWSGE